MKIHMLQKMRGGGWRGEGKEGSHRASGSGCLSLLPLWLIAKSWNTKAGKKRLFKNYLIRSVGAWECQQQLKDPAIQRISPSVLPSPSRPLALYLAPPLRIIFTSLAFQKKSYLYESCVAGAVASLSLLGYETGAMQPARLGEGLSEGISHRVKFTGNKLPLSLSQEGRSAAGCAREYRGFEKEFQIVWRREEKCVAAPGEVNRI